MKAIHPIVALLVMCSIGIPAVFSPAQTAPQPNEAQVAWQLEIDYQTPQPILVKLPGESRPRLYWYMLFTVTNRTGEDRIFAPEIVLYTQTGKMVRAGEGVNPVAFDHIKRLHNNPLLTDLIGMTGKLLQGQDNAKDGVAIFRDFDPEAAQFDIFFGGLSGETAVVKLPVPIEVTEIGEDGKLQKVQRDSIVLSKTLKLTYGLGVEAASRAYAKVNFLEQGWVMR